MTIQANPQTLKPNLPCLHMLQHICEREQELLLDQWFSIPTNGAPAIIENLTNRHENKTVDVGSYFPLHPHLAIPNQAAYVRTLEESVFVSVDSTKAKGDFSLEAGNHRTVFRGNHLGFDQEFDGGSSAKALGETGHSICPIFRNIKARLAGAVK